MSKKIKKKKKFLIIEDKSYTFIDLFCGIGGFHQALKQINCDNRCVLACDINKDCRAVYKDNYGIEPHPDIRKLTLEEIPLFDILCAGFPCQSFSNAGKKKGQDDKRGMLFDEIIRIAKEKQPKFMFLENVKHIKKIDGGKMFRYIINTIKDIGYHIKCKKADEVNVEGEQLIEDNGVETIFELSPHQLGIPQDRKRIIFVCIRKDIYDPTKKLTLTLDDNPTINFDKIIEKDKSKTEKHKISKDIEDVLHAWDEMIQKFEVDEKLSPTILCDEFENYWSYIESKNETTGEIVYNEEFKHLAQWRQDYIIKNRPIYEKYEDEWDKWFEKYKTILNKRKIYCKLEWQTGKKKPNDSIWNHFIQLRQSGIRVKKNKFFPTLVAIVQTPIYGKEKRYITPRECARLQSFPDSFRMHENDHKAYKQFGNAVNVEVVKKIISMTLDAYKYL